MMTATTIPDIVDKATAAKVTDAIRDVLKAHGLEASRVRFGYGDGYSLTIAADPIGFDRDAFEWTAAAVYFDLPVDALGKEVEVQGHAVRIVGLNPRADKRPVIAADTVSGERWLFTAEAIRAALGIPEPTMSPERRADIEAQARAAVEKAIAATH